MDRNFYYFINHNGEKNKIPLYVICDTGGCASSDESFDINFFDLAHNEKVINLLNLLPFGVGRPDGSRWFASYLSAFSNNDDNQYEKLITNPVIRVLVCDEKLRSEMKLIPGLKWNEKGPEPEISNIKRDNYRMSEHMYDYCDGGIKRNKI